MSGKESDKTTLSELIETAKNLKPGGTDFMLGHRSLGQSEPWHARTVVKVGKYEYTFFSSGETAEDAVRKLIDAMRQTGQGQPETTTWMPLTDARPAHTTEVAED